jgi:hypothetical protein
MTPPRLLLVVLVLTALTAVGTGVVQAGDGRPPSGGVGAGGVAAGRAETGHVVVRHRGAPTDPGAAALAVLRNWDVRRSAAWARGDAAAAGPLYTAGSAAGRRDRAMLRRYAERGLRVRGLRMQVLEASLLARSAGRIVLDVTDRVAGGVVVGPGVRARLPTDRATRRIVVLRRVAGEWRVAAVRAQA